MRTLLPDGLPVLNGNAYQAVAQPMTFKVVTWAVFARHLGEEIMPLLVAAGRVAERAVVDGFVADLERRVAER